MHHRFHVVSVKRLLMQIVVKRKLCITKRISDRTKPSYNHENECELERLCVLHMCYDTLGMPSQCPVLHC